RVTSGFPRHQAQPIGISENFCLGKERGPQAGKWPWIQRRTWSRACLGRVISSLTRGRQPGRFRTGLPAPATDGAARASPAAPTGAGADADAWGPGRAPRAAGREVLLEYRVLNSASS